MKLIGFAGRNGSGKDTAAEHLSASWNSIAYGDGLKRFIHQLFGTPIELLWGTLEVKNTYGLSMSPEQWDQWEVSIGRNQEAITSLFEGLKCSHDPVELLLETFHALRAAHFGGQPVTIRKLMQVIGTDWGRKVNADVWVRLLKISFAGIESGEFTYGKYVGLIEERSDDIPNGYIVTDIKYINELRAVQELGGKVFWINVDQRSPHVPGDHSSQPMPKHLADDVDGEIDNNGSLDEFLAAVKAKANEVYTEDGDMIGDEGVEGGETAPHAPAKRRKKR